MPDSVLRAMPGAHEAYARFRETKFFGSLDGLRCLSILVVVWHHARGSAFTDVPLLVSIGQEGLVIFFLMSGFLTTTLMLREKETTGSIRLAGFYIRRALRLFPLYYAVLAAYMLIVWATERSSPEGQAFWQHLPAYATLTSNWFVSVGLGERVIFSFAWALATEEQFYLFWPAVERFMRSANAVMAAVLLIAVDQAVTLGLLDAVIPPASFAHIVLGSLATPICTGVLLAHALHSRPVFERLWPVLGRPSSAAWALPVFALEVYLRFYVGGWWGELLSAVVVCGLFGACVIRNDHALAGFLSNRTLVWMGKISYGIYLMHMLSLNVADRLVVRPLAIPSPWSSVTKYLVGLMIVTLVSSLSFIYYESFFLRLKSRFSRPRVAPAPAAPARRPVSVEFS